MVKPSKPVILTTCPKCSGRIKISEPFTNKTSFQNIEYICDLCGGSGRVLAD